MKQLLIILLLSPIGCFAQFKYISLNANYVETDKMSKKEIPVYLRKADAPKKYTEIGLITCDGFKDKKRFRKAKKKAARHGATGLILITPSEETEHIKSALGKRHAHETRFIAIKAK